MSLAPTNTYRPGIDGIVKMAMQLSGLVPSGANIASTNHKHDAQMCREMLQAIVDEIPARGATMRTTRFENISLTADDYTYELDSDVIDVLGNAQYISAGEDVDKASGETLVQQVNIAEWDRLSSKDAGGQPTMMFVYRGGSTIELRFWPIPTEAGTVRIKTHARSFDSVYGQYDVDLEPWWIGYLQHELAARFAFAKGLDQKGAAMHSLAEQKFRYCKNKSGSRVEQRFAVSHNTGWGRR